MSICGVHCDNPEDSGLWKALVLKDETLIGSVPNYRTWNVKRVCRPTNSDYKCSIP